ncbi:FRIGIDA-like protein 4a [Tanacetum coccineum]
MGVLWMRWRRLRRCIDAGVIPPSLGYLSNLYWLDILENQLSGSNPYSTFTSPGLDMLKHAKHLVKKRAWRLLRCGRLVWRSVAGLRLENVKASEVHTFLQHLVTFGIAKADDFDLYWKLVVGPAWRKQMPKLVVSLGLGDKMPGIFLILHSVFGVYLI